MIQKIITNKVNERIWVLTLLLLYKIKQVYLEIINVAKICWNIMHVSLILTLWVNFILRLLHSQIHLCLKQRLNSFYLTSSNIMVGCSFYLCPKKAGLCSLSSQKVTYSEMCIFPILGSFFTLGQKNYNGCHHRAALEYAELLNVLFSRNKLLIYK